MTSGALGTVLVPVAADAPADLFRTVGSVLAQSGDGLLLVDVVLADDAPASLPVAAALARRSRLVRVVQGDAQGVPGLLRAGLEGVGTPLVAVLEPGDVALADGLRRLAHLASTPSPAVLAYADEQWDGPDGLVVRLKPDLSPTRLQADDYVGRPALLATADLHEFGGWNDGAGTAAEWDAALRLAARRPDRVRHLPVIAVHRARPPGHLAADALAVLRGYLDRTGQRADVEPAAAPGQWRVVRRLPDPAPAVSVVVPTAGAVRDVDGAPVELVMRCLDGLVNATDYPAWDAVVVVSAHAPEGLEDRARALDPRIRSLRLPPGGFNFSDSVNAGVGATGGELVLLLNDDVAPLGPGWLRAMVQATQEPDVEVVGAKLLLPDGRLQHAGVAHDDRFHPTHPHMLEPDGTGYFGDLDVDVDYAAVTAACMLTTREAFVRVGGFWPGLSVAYGDVDYCWKVAVTGGRCVLTPSAVLRHDESSSRDRTVSPHELRTYLEHWEEHARRDLSVHFRSTKW